MTIWQCWTFEGLKSQYYFPFKMVTNLTYFWSRPSEITPKITLQK